MTSPPDASALPGSGVGLRVFGFPVSVPLSAFVGVVVIALLWYPEFIGTGSQAVQWLLAAVFAVLLMISVFLHELAHGVAARAFRYDVTGITLWAMGGFTTYRTGRRHGPGNEVVIALAGPATTLAVAGVAAVAAEFAPAGSARVLLSAVASANLLIGLFNLLPGAPLDGGSVVKAAVWAATGSQPKGQLVAGWVGRGLAVLVFAAPFLLAWWYGVPLSLTLLLVGAVVGGMLWFGASASLKAAQAGAQLQAVPAFRLGMPVVPISEHATVAEALARASEHRFVVTVDAAGSPTAVLVPAAAQAVPPEQRDRMQVAAVSTRLPAAPPTLPVDATASDVLAAKESSGSRFVFVRGPDGAPRLIDTDAAFVVEGP